MDKTIIEQFKKPISDKKAKEFYSNIALPIICESLDEVSKKIELINENCIKIFAMGEYTNATAIDETGGEVEVVIACSNPQLQISNKALQKEYSEASKKEKSQVNTKNSSDEIMKALFKALQQHFAATTTLICYAQGIKVLCKEEFGFNLLIRFATYNENDDDLILSFWNLIKKQAEPINIFLYADEVDQKNLITKGNYGHMVRILKSLRKTMLTKNWISANVSTRYLVEALVYNIPSKLLIEKDFEKAYAKGILYLQNCPLTEFKSFEGKPINKCQLIKANYGTVKTFINNISRLD